MESNMYISQNKSGVVILILDKVELRRENITNKDKEIKAKVMQFHNPGCTLGSPDFWFPQNQVNKPGSEVREQYF